MSEPTMIERVESVPAGTSVDGLVEWVLQRGLDLGLVTFSGGHLKWQSPQTEEEAARRAEWKARADERQEKWERETYERLRLKFEAEDSAARAPGEGDWP